MFKPTYLYIKTHNITGLKYFGKTTSKDPYKYKGSGVYWGNHIKFYGYDVTTEIIGYYIDKDECKQKAIEFSITNDIVQSKNWANLKEERLDGGFDHINENRDFYVHNRKNAENRDYHDPAYTKKISDSIKKLWNSRTILEKESITNKMLETKIKNGTFSKIDQLNNDQAIENRKEKYRKINHQQKEKNSQFGTIWIFNVELKQNKKISKTEKIPDGWIKGRKMKF